ncbi:MAG: PspA/IM30 family protein [Myxococcales bacterium]|nr:PspA/IM30 family protein [Myxococcales bacterium]
MGLIDRLGRAFKSNVNALIDKAEDPGKILAQTIDDMSEELKKARQEVVSSLASVKTLEKKQREVLEESSNWEKRAMLALEQGDEELAREALKRKKKAEGDALDMDKTRETQQQYVDELRATIDQLEKKLEELKARKNTLASQVGKARAAAGNTDVGGANSGAVGRIREMQERIANMEAEVEAHEVLDDPKKVDIEERFRRLERGEGKGDLDDDLAALKARLKK